MIWLLYNRLYPPCPYFNPIISPPGVTLTFPVWHGLSLNRLSPPCPRYNDPSSRGNFGLPSRACLSFNRLYPPCTPYNYPSPRGNFHLPSQSALLISSPNLRSSFPLFRGGKERLIQLLEYLSVPSPESGLFSDWSRNKRYLELSR